MPDDLLLDASSNNTLPPLTRFPAMGTAKRPDGSTITANSQSLLRDGQPWLPVMGEFHFSRYPEGEWREELLKMKMGGIDIIATYVFWIHHEEVEGEWDWHGQRSLRAFVQLCADLGLYSVVRCGPWCHGECRNGGLPDWLLSKGFATRSDDPGYLSEVRRLYGQIADQIQGLLWKDGGPVIGIQCENEYTGPAEHLLNLKRIAREAGIDVPLYTRTGWPDLSTPLPFGKLLPLFGGYPDGFWDRSVREMPPGYAENFLFRMTRNDASVATDQLGIRDAEDTADEAGYPYFACEIGGGMMSSYHRRIRIAPRDIEALGLAKIGSGNNLQGYYMYHGGTNPESKRTTLQESQATGYWNDLPVQTYDFQAPLGEFGQIREHYHSLRRTHLFLRDFGVALATMPARLPDIRPVSSTDTATLRWSVRSNGNSGFLFVNNYQRLQHMPAKEKVRFNLCLPDTCLRLPKEPATLPADSAFFWPFGLDLGGIPLIYATAQPICRVEDQGIGYYVFAQTTGVPAEFVFPSAEVEVETASGEMTFADGQVRVANVPTGTSAALQVVRTSSGGRIVIMLLDEEQSRACWKGTLLRRERIFLTRAGLTLDGDTLHLCAEDSQERTIAIFPDPGTLLLNGIPAEATADGLFHRFTAPREMSEKKLQVSWEQVRAAGPARSIHNGSQGVAEAPTETDFEAAAVWRLRLPEDVDTSRDLLLRLRYAGDVARLYLDGKLLTDNFYNGAAFEVGLKRWTPEIYSGELLLQVLPLRRDAPIYLPKDAWPEAEEEVATLCNVDVVEMHRTTFRCLCPEPEEDR